MDTFLDQKKEKRGINKGLVIGVVIGVIAIASLIFLVSRRPSMQDQMTEILAGSYREGSPEFDSVTKDIIISTGDNTVQSPNGFGKISMYIAGKIRNKGTRTINGLEVNCAVVTQFNDVLREKRILVVPTKQPVLEPNQTIDITTQIDGFDPQDDRANIRWKVTAIRLAN